VTPGVLYATLWRQAFKAGGITPVTVTMSDRYAALTGGTPTPGPEPWPAAVARIAAVIPETMAGDTRWLPALYPEGLAALALGTYIIAAEGARPPGQVTLSQVWDALRAPSGDPSWGPSVSQDHVVRAWSARLAALGHDPNAGIRRPAWRKGLNSTPGYALTCGEDVRLAYGHGPQGAPTRWRPPG
jgi:hypothetical protein